jgi:hypothetical protein
MMSSLIFGCSFKCINGIVVVKNNGVLLSLGLNLPFYMSHLRNVKESLTQPPITCKLQVEMLYVQWHVYLHQLGEEFMCNQTHDYHVIVIAKQCVTFEQQLKDELHEHLLIYNLCQPLGPFI